MSYICKGELEDWINNWLEKDRYYHPYSKSNNIPISELLDILKIIPEADVVERKEGGTGVNDHITLKIVLETTAWMGMYLADPLRLVDVTMTYKDLMGIYKLIDAYISKQEVEK